MATLVRCRKCNRPFEPDACIYCGEDFCPACRAKPQEAVVEARRESYEQFLKMGYDKDEADRRAMEFAEEVQRRRRERGE